MGTRGAWGFYKDGVTKATYNHLDSYPSCLGQVMKEFCMVNDPADFEEIFNELKMVNANDVPSVDDYIKLGTYRNNGVNGGADEYYDLLRETQGEPQCYINDPNLKVMIDSGNFLQDSLFCEWAYIINLENNELEIYRGFIKSPPKNSRYYDGGETREGYYPVDMVKSIPFESLDEFDMDKLEEEIYEK